MAVLTLFLLSGLLFFGTSVLPGDVGRRILGGTANDAAVDALNREQGARHDEPHRAEQRQAGRRAAGARRRERLQAEGCQRERSHDQHDGAPGRDRGVVLGRERDEVAPERQPCRARPGRPVVGCIASDTPEHAGARDDGDGTRAERRQARPQRPARPPGACERGEP